MISLRGGLQKSLISLQGGINIGPPEYCGVVNFFHKPHFIGFLVVNVRKTHCRVPIKISYCRVGGGPTCCAEIAAGWSELFSDITAGYPPDKGKIAAGWSEKSSADTPPSNFLNGIALSIISVTNILWRARLTLP